MVDALANHGPLSVRGTIAMADTGSRAYSVLSAVLISSLDRLVEVCRCKIYPKLTFTLIHTMPL
jgi:hypothetical protein